MLQHVHSHSKVPEVRNRPGRADGRASASLQARGKNMPPKAR